MRKLMENSETLDNIVEQIQTTNTYKRTTSQRLVMHQCPTCSKELHIGHFVVRAEVEKEPEVVKIYHECNRCNNVKKPIGDSMGMKLFIANLCAKNVQKHNLV